ncbi:ribonuclease III [[Mycoplasma] collis]|uniref:ribonuclease III n=1 Tax=[Mycoplasma] collis TaxID=2127 RepID=UPI00051BDA43|nr:ribonuclease III [[Mycoplasma] collis]
MNSKINELLKKINIIPNKIELYIQAFTHKTYSNENKNTPHYEILEFLGDALINFKTSLLIYNSSPLINEGDATIQRSKIVNTNALAKIAHNLKLNSYLKISKGSLEILDNPKVNADLFEALCGAIFLDQGEEKLEFFLKETLYKLFENNKQIVKDPKSLLQEYFQGSTKKTATYKTIWNETNFESKVIFEEQIYGRGSGKSKKEAETNAAINALERLKYEVN